MKYDFKILPEIAWAVAIAIVITVATLAVDFEPETIQDWERWAVVSAGALARSIGAAVLARLTT